MRTRTRLGSILAAFSFVLAPSLAGASCTLGKVAELPVTMAGLQPLLEARFNGEPVRLEADSGAFFSMISDAAAQEHHLPREPAPMGLYIRGVNGDASVDIARVRTFTLAGHDIPDVQFLVGGTDIGSAAGVLGRNVLGAFDAEYDFGGGAVRLFKPHDCGRADLAYWNKDRADTVVPMGWSQGKAPEAVIDAKVNGVPIRAILDTGGGASALSLRAARRLGIDVNGPGVEPAGRSMGFGRRLVQGWLVPVARFEIGNETITNSKLRVADYELSDGDMLLGADFFLSHRVLISNSQRKVYFTYQGGPVFDLAQHPKMATDNQTLAPQGEPTDAEGYSRRGAALQARGEGDAAIADFGKAMQLAPKEPRYALERAQARLAAHRPILAMDDLDTVLALDPANVEARLLRSVLRRAGRDDDAAGADLDAAAKAVSPEANLRLEIGELYLGLDRFDPAIDQFDLWVRYHPEDARLGQALNGRCWARALAGRELDRALADCNRAVGLYPNSGEVRDSRGLVRLRRGEYARAIADYDAALKLAPKTAWSLYGRGLAELKTGAPDAGHADIAAAEALAPKLAERARKLGVAPDGAGPTPAPASTALAPSSGRAPD